MNTYRAKLYIGHIIIWLLNYWFVALGSEFSWNGFSYEAGTLAYAYAYGLFFNAVVFYLQVFWLFGKVYKRYKKIYFYLATILVIAIVSMIETYCDFKLYSIFNVYGEKVSGVFMTNFIVHAIYSAAGFYYIVKFEYKRSEKQKQKLLEETYKTELKYLKAQLNPHFLFNAINSVYHLIGKDDALAKETLLQFSVLLRYQLYESNTHILLKKELDYVLKYIKIEETRKGSDIRLEYNVKSENPTLKIAPLLLIPFIENAFKHCSNHMDGNANTIEINIEEVESNISLNVVNSYDHSIHTNAVGGIGLNNVQKRLSLLYPNQHQLRIDKDNTHHTINLSINL